MNRWWVYQRERFPLLAHGPLIAAFSASAVSFSGLLRGGARPALVSYAVAFAVSLCSFLQLRIADEFKDADEDAEFRPYRPVPRGLVKLNELALIGALAAALQFTLAFALGLFAVHRPPTMEIGPLTGHTQTFMINLPVGNLRLVGLLLVTWTYFTLMSREFFAREWLKARPVVYLFSHMLIMPLVDWFATGCDWVYAGGAMPRGLFWFLAASFCNGIVIELGRKIRAPEQEERGVQTYTALWGPRIAVGAWLAAMAATLGCALVAARRIDFTAGVATTLGLALAGAIALGVAFVRTGRGTLAKRVELYSGVWTLALYLSLGVIPLVLRHVFP